MPSREASILSSKVARAPLTLQLLGHQPIWLLFDGGAQGIQVMAEALKDFSGCP